MKKIFPVVGIFLAFFILAGMKNTSYDLETPHGFFNYPDESFVGEFTNLLETFDCVNFASVQTDDLTVYICLDLKVNADVVFYPLVANQMEKFAYLYFPSCEYVEFSFEEVLK